MFSISSEWIFSLLLVTLPTQTVTDSRSILREAGFKPDESAIVEYLKKQSPEDPEKTLLQIRSLIRKLGDESFAVRENASEELIHLGLPAIPELKQALKSSDHEVRYRATHCLEQLQSDNLHRLHLAMVRILAENPSKAAADSLLDFLPFAGEENLTDEIFESLVTQAKKGEPGMTSLINGLRSRSPVKRGKAAEILGLAGAVGQKDRLRQLLEDPSAKARFGAALGLVYLKDRNAVSILIGLVDSVSEDDAKKIEDILLTLSEGNAPGVPLGKTPEEKKKFARSFGEWWHREASRVNLSLLDKNDEANLLFSESFSLEDPAIKGRYRKLLLENPTTSKISASKGVLRFGGDHDIDQDQSLSINSQQLLGKKTFPRKFQVKTSMSGEEGNSGGWHVGVSVGNMRLLFHPGLEGGGFRAERVDNKDKLTANMDMSFTPNTGLELHDITIDVTTTDDMVRLDTVISEGGKKTGKTWKKTLEFSKDVMGDVNRIGLYRSGYKGGAGLFGPLVIRR